MSRRVCFSLFYLPVFLKMNAGEGITEFGYNWNISIQDTFSNENSTLWNSTKNNPPNVFTGTTEESVLEKFSSRNGIVIDEYSGYYGTIIEIIYHVRFAMSVAGIIGNTINIIVCLQPNFRHLPVTPYMVALAVSDSLALYCSPFVVALKKYTGHKIPDLTQMCNVRRYLSVGSLCSSALCLCAISIQRMIAIRYPLHAKLWLKKRVIYCSLVVIIVYVASTFAPLLMSFTTTCRIKRGWSMVYVYHVLLYHLLISNHILPDLILVISNTLLAISINNTILRESTESAVHGSKANTAKKCTIMALTLAAAHLLLTTPLTVYSIIDALDIYSDTGPIQELVHVSIYLLATTNHAINFFLCVATSSSFRQSLKTLLSCQVCRRLRPREHANSSETMVTSVEPTAANRSIA